MAQLWCNVYVPEHHSCHREQYHSRMKPESTWKVWSIFPISFCLMLLHGWCGSANVHLVMASYILNIFLNMQ
jgi:hypothetical protein